MDSVKQVEAHLGQPLSRLIGCQAMVDGFGERFTGEFLGVVRDDYGDYCAVVRRQGAVVLEQFHVSRITPPGSPCRDEPSLGER
jgi:hypothetical protein